MSLTARTTVRPAPPEPATAAEMRRRAEALVPLLRERAVETDRERRVSREVYDRLCEEGFFHLLKPRRYGGFELTDHDHAMVTMTLARGCASTAWVFSILSSDNLGVLAFPQEVQEEIWGVDTYATLAGNLNVDPRATTTRVDGGYLVTGRWGFCSGSDFSDWLILNAPVDGVGHMFLLRNEEAEMIDDWYPTGMRGTGSRSQSVTEVFVPDRRVMVAADIVHALEARRALHPEFDALYATYPPTGRFSFAATAVGAARGAMEFFAETVGSSTRVTNALGGESRLVEQDYVATEFAESAAEIEAAWTIVEERSRTASERARQRREATEAESAREMRDNAMVTRMSLRAVQRLAALIGSKTGSNDHPVTRARRDIEMASHHVTLNWREASVRYLRAVAG